MIAKELGAVNCPLKKKPMRQEWKPMVDPNINTAFRKERNQDFLLS